MAKRPRILEDEVIAVMRVIHHRHAAMEPVEDQLADTEPGVILSVFHTGENSHTPQPLSHVTKKIPATEFFFRNTK